MKWSAPLVTGSIGTRLTRDQLRPSLDLLKTISLDEHALRKRQSCQTT
jgi:hypothetical protein